jgi:lycopene cyclase domain-containing protein
MIGHFFGRYTYLFLDLISIFFPLILSFDKKVHFYTHWWRLFPAIIIGAVSFLIWDEWFAQAQVWSFNPDYITGIFIGHLPLEEWLFFICIPFSCFFIYECLKAYFPDVQLNTPVIVFMLIPLFLLIGLPHYQKIYTVITFVGSAVMLLLHYIIFNKKHLTFFFLMWLVHLIPLFIINGFLTGIPVVSYDDNENLGIRIGTIPIEDAFYSMFLLLINLTVYEGLLKFREKTYG